MMARRVSLWAAVVLLAVPLYSYAQQDHGIPLPDGMHVQLLHDETHAYRFAFLVNLNDLATEQ